MCYTRENIKKSYKNNAFKIPDPTWDQNVDITDGWYSVSDSQDYLEYILKDTEKKLIIFH